MTLCFKKVSLNSPDYFELFKLFLIAWLDGNKSVRIHFILGGIVWTVFTHFWCQMFPLPPQVRGHNKILVKKREHKNSKTVIISRSYFNIKSLQILKRLKLFDQPEYIKSWPEYHGQICLSFWRVWYLLEWGYILAFETVF